MIEVRSDWSPLVLTNANYSLKMNSVVLLLTFLEMTLDTLFGRFLA